MEKGIISNIQHFSLGDGPGIRTTVFLKGCNLHCPWCHNPETVSPRPQLLYFDRLCLNCGACAQICSLHSAAPGRHLFDRSGCGGCGGCAQACPSGALKQYGKAMSAEQIMAEILQDTDFYAASGGGVTLSGGEPLLQADFCSVLAQKCQSLGINVLLDTAGSVDYAQFEKLLPYISHVYLDLKGADPDKMKKVTGAELSLISDNLGRLLRDKINITLRIPVIPGYNDMPDSAVEQARFILSHGNIPVHLLPFHRLGSEKYKGMGKDYIYRNTPAPDPEKMQELKQIFSDNGINAEITG